MKNNSTILLLVIEIVNTSSRLSNEEIAVKPIGCKKTSTRGRNLRWRRTDEINWCIHLKCIGKPKYGKQIGIHLKCIGKPKYGKQIGTKSWFTICKKELNLAKELLTSFYSEWSFNGAHPKV